MNQKVVEILNKFAEIHELLGNNYREKAYKTAAMNIKKLTYSIMIDNKGNLIGEKIPGVGKLIENKIIEYLKTGKIDELDQLENSPAVKASRIFSKILGVGPQTIRKWLKMEIFDLVQLRRAIANGSIELTTMQKYGLTYYIDLNTRIPRQEVKQLSNYIHKMLLQLDSNILFEVCGSYKRESPDSGDIDILVSNSQHFNDSILELLSMQLNMDSNFIDTISMGKERITFLYKSPISGLARQIDILNIRYSSYYAAVLYFTGDWSFNEAMRSWAKSRGYRLNQSGLYKINSKKTKNGKKSKTSELTIIHVDSETEIFDILGLQYVEPRNRTATAVVPKQLFKNGV